MHDAAVRGDFFHLRLAQAQMGDAASFLQAVAQRRRGPPHCVFMEPNVEQLARQADGSQQLFGFAVHDRRIVLMNDC